MIKFCLFRTNEFLFLKFFIVNGKSIIKPMGAFSTWIGKKTKAKTKVKKQGDVSEFGISFSPQMRNDLKHGKINTGYYLSSTLTLVKVDVPIGFILILAVFVVDTLKLFPLRRFFCVAPGAGFSNSSVLPVV